MDADGNAVAPLGSGDAIDREIRAALAVEPSPEFLARVRTRIASEPVAASAMPWGRPWMFAAAGVAASVLVLAVVLSRPASSPGRPGALEPGAAPVVAQADVTLTPDAAALPPVARPAWVAQAVPPQLAAPVAQAFRPAHVRAEPEVLVDPAEARALRRVIAGTRNGTLDLGPMLHATTPTVMDLPPTSPITIPPITIDPLASSSEEGVRQ